MLAVRPFDWGVAYGETVDANLSRATLQETRNASGNPGGFDLATRTVILNLENTQLYHFALSVEEMERINALDRNEKHD